MDTVDSKRCVCARVSVCVCSCSLCLSPCHSLTCSESSRGVEGQKTSLFSSSDAQEREAVWADRQEDW